VDSVDAALTMMICLYSGIDPINAPSDLCDLAVENAKTPHLVGDDAVSMWYWGFVLWSKPSNRCPKWRTEVPCLSALQTKWWNVHERILCRRYYPNTAQTH